MLFRNCELGGRRCDVSVRRGRIAAIGDTLMARGDEQVLEARGGALLPGLHDHHLHLFGLASALSSVACGPPEVEDEQALAERLRGATPRSGWVRGVGYHESVAGHLDRRRLSGFRSDLPVRVQHRTGALWMVNDLGAKALGLDAPDLPEGVERDAAGRATGRLFRLDGWLRERLPGSGPPDLAEVGRLLARHGVTGVTDAGADNTPRSVGRLLEARKTGDLPQRLQLLGSSELGRLDVPAGVQVGAVKILLDEPRLPQPERLADRIREAHAAGRGVAIHAVTRAELVLALAALEEAGAEPADRVEHASVAPPDCVAWIRRLGVRVVSQPIFVRERGETYLTEVEERDRPWLYPGRAWLDAGVPLAAGSDAPYGSPDPWLAMAAAVGRETRCGARLAPGEALLPDEALALFLGPLEAPGAPPRVVEPGVHADLCLLDAAWSEVRSDLRAEHVAATVCGGHLAWQAPHA
ncbi:MAG: amidohydrolase [Deltaproteobacteria bacterium]|nr:amidohydrolase [Deltaproteobacteria bacterium]